MLYFVTSFYKQKQANLGAARNWISLVLVPLEESEIIYYNNIYNNLP